MPAGFLCIYSDLSNDEALKIAHRAHSLLPFEAWESSSFEHANGKVRGWSWSCAEQAARGGYAHQDFERSSWTAFDGWFVEEGRIGDTLASVLHDAMTTQTFRHTMSHTDGAFSAVHIDAEGIIYASRDAANAQHLYYGQRQGIIAVSNRAMLVAAALARGDEPVRDASFCAWWLSTSMAPLTFEPSPWRGVKNLTQSTMLRITQGRVEAINLEAARPYDSWDEARAAHIARSTAWRRLPGIRTRLPLTGGKDSRALLAGIIADNALGELDHVYLRASEDHPDAIVARELATRCGLRLELGSIQELLAMPLHEQLAIHLFRTESRFHAWDIKALPDTSPMFSLGGHFGELYRSHVSSHLLMGWEGVELLLTSERAVNQHGALSRESCAMIKAHASTWISRKREEGLNVLAARDHWHREARMWQWATDAVRADSVGMVTCAPLASARLVAGYDSQTLLEQRAERTHFELMRVAPDWLWQHRFAQASWRRELMPWMRRKPVPGATSTATSASLSRQVLLWEHSRQEMVDLLCEPDRHDPFFDVFDRDGVRDLVARYTTSAQRDTGPDLYLLKGIFGLLGARVAMRGGVGEHRLQMDRE